MTSAAARTSPSTSACTKDPCLAVTLNDRQDYFGQTVNIASRVQGLADPTAVLATQPIVESAEVARLVGEAGYRTNSRQLSLRGVSEAFDDLRDSRARAGGRGGVRRGGDGVPEALD